MGCPEAGEWDRLSTEAEQLYHSHQLGEAEKVWLNALAVARRDSMKSRVALGLTSIAVIRLEQGRTAAAERALSEAVEIYHRCGANCAAGLGVTYRNLAMVYQQQGQFAGLSNTFAEP